MRLYWRVVSGRDFGGVIMSMGPKIVLNISCVGCECCTVKPYSVLSEGGTESGVDVLCEHPSLEAPRYIGDGQWATPPWCPTRGSDPVKLSQAYDAVLRDVMSYLGMGGFGSEGMVDPNAARDKIAQGIDRMLERDADDYVREKALQVEKRLSAAEGSMATIRERFCSVVAPLEGESLSDMAGRVVRMLPCGMIRE